MKVFITGGQGFVGRHLTNLLLRRGHSVTATGTRQTMEVPRHENFHYIVADTTREGDWQQSASEADTLINLAGRSIFKRWSESYKRQIYDSRIVTTRHLVAAITGHKQVTLLSTSAVGYYGNRGNDILVESEPSGTDFLATLAKDWETEAMAAEKKGCRVAVTRFGIVLGNGGGALAKMLPAFKFFIGGSIGSGNHWVPWIHMDDVTAALLFLMEAEGCEGLFNFSAPGPLKYGELSSALGRVLKRPSFMKTPAFALRLAMGELGDVLLASQRAVPHRLLEAGYTFKYTDIESALIDLVQPPSTRADSHVE